MGALRCSDNSMSSSVYESLPPERHTMTRSPSRIIAKSSIALPVRPRRCACRRFRVFDGIVACADVTVASNERAADASGGGAAWSRARVLEVASFEVTEERGGRQRLAGGRLQQLLHAQLRAHAVHVLAQPAEETGKVPARDLRIELRHSAAQRLVELRRDHGPERVRREIPERAYRPV